MKIAIILLLGLVIALVLLFNNYLPFIIMAILFYLWALIVYPEVALWMSIMAIFDFFSMISEDFLRMPYLFRIRDIALILAFIPLFIGVYKKDERLRHAFSCTIAKIIYMILALTALQMLFTKARFPNETFNSILRIGRRYIYYSLFFPALYILLDRNRLTRFLILFTTSVIIFSTLYILQFLLGPSPKIFLFGRVEYQLLHGFEITRIYVKGVGAATLIFHISFMLFLLYKDFGRRIKNTIVLILSGLQTLFTFGRAHIFGAIAGTIVGILIGRKRSLLKNIAATIAIFTLLLLFGETISTVFFTRNQDFFKAISSRVASSYETIRYQKDTVEARIADSLGRFGLIKYNPVSGIGFVHDESNLFALERGYEEGIRTSDSGIITLLLDFGFLGLIWLFVTSYVVLRKGLYLYKITDSALYKSSIAGILAFYFGRLFSFVTLLDFVIYDGIVVIVLALAGLEIINYHISIKENG